MTARTTQGGLRDRAGQRRVLFDRQGWSLSSISGAANRQFTGFVFGKVS
jgi:hypothetical protein